MLLETLDIKKNDILIYSQNIFDLENNFKIIYKDDLDKKPHKISYGEVCRFVNEFNPKNMIVYRMLTNIPDFEIFLSKYGFFLNINGATELIYFDPVFAVKELEEYSKSLEYDLRFRIQQVGLTTLSRYKNLPNYAEIYSVDMQAVEAKNQNDKVFADAIFAIEKVSQVPIQKEEQVKRKEPEPIKKREMEPLRKNTEMNTILKNKTNASIKNQDKPLLKGQDKSELKKDFNINYSDTNTDIKIKRHDLSEDKDFDYRQIMKINYRGAGSESRKNPAVVSKQNESRGNTSESSFGKFLQSKQINQNSKNHLSLGDVSKDHLSDIYKSPNSLRNLVEGGEDKKIVLKLNKK